jgi:hypothetical protein
MKPGAVPWSNSKPIYAADSGSFRIELARRMRCTMKRPG